MPAQLIYYQGDSEIVVLHSRLPNTHNWLCIHSYVPISGAWLYQRDGDFFEFNERMSPSLTYYKKDLSTEEDVVKARYELVRLFQLSGCKDAA